MDFRAPENFLFVPLWMLRSLRAKPYDVVFMTWVKLNDGVTIELQPHQDAFLKLANPRSVLENELKYYSSATRGSTISLLYEGTQYDFDVTDCVGQWLRAENERELDVVASMPSTRSRGAPTPSTWPSRRLRVRERAAAVSRRRRPAQAATARSSTRTTRSAARASRSRTPTCRWTSRRMG